MQLNLTLKEITRILASVTQPYIIPRWQLIILRNLIQSNLIWSLEIHSGLTYDYLSFNNDHLLWCNENKNRNHKQKASIFGLLKYMNRICKPFESKYFLMLREYAYYKKMRMHKSSLILLRNYLMLYIATFSPKEWNGINQICIKIHVIQNSIFFSHKRFLWPINGYALV